MTSPRRDPLSPPTPPKGTGGKIPASFPDPLIPYIAGTKYAVAAILLSEEGDYLLQQRDGTPGIWHPNMLGLFGGTIEEGEEAGAALRRELAEELEFSPRQLTYFSFAFFGTSEIAPGSSCRIIYEACFTREEWKQMVLSEGASMKIISSSDIVGRKYSIVPVDLHMLYIHMMCHDIVAQPD
jgi:8-oxo-dGTP pyrophosphatase MutT (NUDIX family)|tara:strand:- start:446 stop:991 length:546 start_codon:yes stop_codon:yes gene_type:complete